MTIHEFQDQSVQPGGKSFRLGWSVQRGLCTAAPTTSLTRFPAHRLFLDITAHHFAKSLL